MISLLLWRECLGMMRELNWLRCIVALQALRVLSVVLSWLLCFANSGKRWSCQYMYCIVCGAMVSSPWRLLAIIYAVCVVLIVATGRVFRNVRQFVMMFVVWVRVLLSFLSTLLASVTACSVCRLHTCTVVWSFLVSSQIYIFVALHIGYRVTQKKLKNYWPRWARVSHFSQGSV